MMGTMWHKSSISLISSLYIIIWVFCPRAGPSLQPQEPRLQFCQRQVFHCKLRTRGCGFTRDWIDAVASCCFLHPTLSLASEQIRKDSRGTNVKVRILDLANWVFQTSPKFTTGVKYQFHQGFDQIRHPELPITKFPRYSCCFTRDLIGVVASCCFLHPTLSLASETDLKRSEKIPGAPTRRWGEWIWLTGPSGLH